MDRLDSLTPLGYSSAGVVLRAGVEASEFVAGDRVACAGAGYANHAEIVFVPRNLCAKVPDSVPLDAAAFGTVGSIALQGIRQAGSTVGDIVAVIGLGLVGQLCVQLLKAAGCRVIGVDLSPGRVQLATRWGAAVGLVREEADTPQIIEYADGRGGDAVLITAATSSSDPLDLAAEICRDRGRIVVVGGIRVEIPNTLKSPFYEKELELYMSRSYGPGRYDPVYEKRGVDYPIGYIRWTEKRNMVAFLGLLAAGDIDVSPLISHRFAFERAEDAYELLTSDPASVIGLLLDYGEPELEVVAPQVWLQPSRKPVAAKQRDIVNLSLIGAGNHARTRLIPALRIIPSVRLRGIATASGLSARDAADKYGAVFATSDYRDILSDRDTDCVVISTRHNTHAMFTIEALRAGKDVFVEKPLALSLDELRDVIVAQRETGRHILVGFNRRFAPHAQRLSTFLGDKIASLLTAVYRVGAEHQAPSVWYQDLVAGGNRIVGECGVFIDLLFYVCDALPTQVYTTGIPDPTLHTPDNVSVTLNFSDGSIATIIYASRGDPSVPKDRLEVFGQGRTAILDDFRALTLVHRGRKRVYRHRWRQDKGHAGEMVAFIAAVEGRQAWPVSFESQALTTLTTLRAVQSLRESRPLSISPSLVFD